MNYIIVSFLLGMLVMYIYLKYKVLPEKLKISYWEGWQDRHQGQPLLPRYWVYISQLYNFDPLDQHELVGLFNKPDGSYEDRLYRGLPYIYSRNSGMEYALSDRELELLNDSKERTWRGLSELEENDIAESRHPRWPEKEDVEMLLKAEFEINDIEKYYNIENLEIEKNIFGKIKKVTSKRIY